MPLGILHPQVAELRANYEKRNLRLPLGPTLNRQTFDQNKPTPIEHLVEYLLQVRSESGRLLSEFGNVVARLLQFLDCILDLANLELAQLLDPITLLCEISPIPCRAIRNLRRQGW